MARINLVDTVVGELCGSMGLPERPLDDQGRLRLRIGDTPVVLSYAGEPLELLWLHVELGDVPEGLSAPRFLLKLGFECWCLNRMTITLDRAGSKAWGFTCIPVAELTLDRLDQVLKAMLAVAMPIRQRILGGDFALPTPGDETSDEMLRV
ncbi:MAG: type III secretion system chaperone [Pseudomonadota bacterium]